MLLALGQNHKKTVYESMADYINEAVGAIEDPRSVVLTVSNDGSVIQLAVRYQYSWL